ncbi:putative sugar transport protein (permease) [Paenibacillus baekrokdamisoli]|uniref:Putative sugar transport protein (Permease) n=1 Tax=Paenibacillus baekrokdamisoli TaxID=1712516 RepID=A0A3G9JIH4_9BACL|nr:carbohydrate ABC transporter permease [Paenibacillus baekrokdamisoli]MBB3068137.1 multiple sugar transport system permease protein [Paenibacillus baekrokdamisoli]BBH22819.1 putative sugar transport protein (permease) [Paenibacillus baekrokdamisoli]
MRKIHLPTLASVILLFVWALILLFPFYWMFLSAFKPAISAIKTPPDLSWANLNFVNFKKLASNSISWIWTFNSLFVAISGMLGNVFLCSMAGYALAKKKFPGKRLIFWLIISVMMTTTQIIMVPLFMLIRDMGLLNTYSGLILPILVSPFAVFLTKQFMQTIPGDLISSAKMDGCSEWRIFYNIILPISMPVLAIVAIFGFITQWNDFLWPLLATESREMRTLQVGLASMQLQNTDYGLILAGSVWTMVPIIVLFLSFQRFFVRGITIGAVKG